MNYDIGIIGIGVAGAIAAYRITERYPKEKIVLLDAGPPPGKRRGQCNGFLGCFPTGDGKIYSADFDLIQTLVDGRKSKASQRWLMELFLQVDAMKLTKDTLPSAAVQKNLKAKGYELTNNNYYQWKPDSVHKLSRIFSKAFEANENVQYNFNNEVFRIAKSKGMFTLNTSNGDVTCKKVLFCVGRSGWRWSTKIFKELGICQEDDEFSIGARIELSGQYMKDWNKSHATIKKGLLEVGPLQWNGTVIPEGHNDAEGQTDLVLSNFRSNEERWRTEKVSFSVLQTFKKEGTACQQVDRLAKLAYLLSNDRVGKEKIKLFLKGKSQLNLVPEFAWMKETFLQLDDVMPSVTAKGSYHVPHILPLSAKINVSNILETDVDGMFIAGESAGIVGLGAAALMGAIAADAIVQK